MQEIEGWQQPWQRDYKIINSKKQETNLQTKLESDVMIRQSRARQIPAGSKDYCFLGLLITNIIS